MVMRAVPMRCEALGTTPPCTTTTTTWMAASLLNKKLPANIDRPQQDQL